MTEPIDLTYDKALMLLKQVVAKAGGDWVYKTHLVDDDDGYAMPSCLYVHDGQADCGIGKALHSAGVSLGELSKWEGARSVGLMRELRRRGVISTDDRAIGLYRIFQSEQDCNTPWGEALEIAIEACDYE